MTMVLLSNGSVIGLGLEDKECQKLGYEECITIAKMGV